MTDARLESEARYGVYRAVVTDIRDPEGRGRVRVRLPSVEDGHEAWAELATLMAGDGSGTWFRPDPDDEVLVAFERGDLRRPYVVGALWSGGDRPPETDESGTNAVKTIRTRCGATITIDDARCEVRIEAPGGIRLLAGGKLEASAAQVAVNAGSADFSGIVRCDTLIANSVVASSYTPGVGNVM
jgi:phage baseplate assembly protein gpV